MLDLFGAGLISCIPANTPLALRRFVFFFSTKSCSYTHIRDLHYPCRVIHTLFQPACPSLAFSYCLSPIASLNAMKWQVSHTPGHTHAYTCVSRLHISTLSSQVLHTHTFKPKKMLYLDNYFMTILYIYPQLALLHLLLDCHKPF
ncbi:uncharacterized protein B0T23DRAFT_388323 [Neurospora hispaniola]|uniref:Uncharacterized protein n=1 Tax=Neurospora hispaniola TaxID=588809 RepID=A0AAJ0I143_9PEZI|nr:hypothetical protein B0T23DRAFT_388323 [Neurospora hispaniola]